MLFSWHEQGGGNMLPGANAGRCKHTNPACGHQSHPWVCCIFQLCNCSIISKSSYNWFTLVQNWTKELKQWSGKGRRVLSPPSFASPKHAFPGKHLRTLERSKIPITLKHLLSTASSELEATLEKAAMPKQLP